MTIPTLVIGDTFANAGTFYAGDPSAPLNISNAVVTVAVVTVDHEIRMCEDTAVVNDNPAYPANQGRIMIEIPADVTAQIADYVTSTGSGLMEIQVNTGGYKYSWFAPINLVRGQIS